MDMATKARIQVLGMTREGKFIVQGTDVAATQLLAKAQGRPDGLRIEAAWPRRRGGSDYPTLRLACSK